MLLPELRGRGLGAVREVILAEVVGCLRVVHNQQLLNVALQYIYLGLSYRMKNAILRQNIAPLPGNKVNKIARKNVNLSANIVASD